LGKLEEEFFSRVIKIMQKQILLEERIFLCHNATKIMAIHFPNKKPMGSGECKL